MVGERTIRGVVVAGGAGFIGSNFARLLLERGYERVRILDKLTYAGNPANFDDLAKLPGFSFVRGDICDAGQVREAIDGFDGVVNFAAETHVDRSLMRAGDFIQTDIHGVYVLLETIREAGTALFVHVSTDEVYGHIEAGSSRESDPLAPRNPYSASKAGGELMVHAFVETHGVPAIVTRGSNTYGPFQYPEKMLPISITNVLQGEPILIYGDGRQVRDWLHVRDHAAAIELLMRRGEAGETYNVGGGNERRNVDMAELVLNELDAPRDMLHHVTDRQGHDRRYSLDSGKIQALGWRPEINFEHGIREAVRWYRDRRDWWEPIRSSEEYMRYFERNYGRRERLDVLS